METLRRNKITKVRSSFFCSSFFFYFVADIIVQCFEKFYRI